MSENKTPEEVVRAWSDAYVRKDLDATSALMSEDFIRLGDSTHWTPISKHDWREIMVNFFTAFPDWHWEARNLVVDGDYIAVHFTVTGTHRGAFQGIEATGRRVSISEFTLYRVEDGKFAEVWDLTDMDAVMRQIT